MKRIKDFIAGRYEAGKDNNKVVVKKNKPVYNNVKWGNSMTDLTGGAVELAKKFVDDKSYKEIVTSTLVYGVQWDATMQFFDNNYIKGTCSENSYVRNSNGKGWFGNSGGIIHNTGVDVDANASNKVKNIYDMAGNLNEWTMEAYNSGSLRVFRGSSYKNGNTSASVRGDTDTAQGVEFKGIRVTLYFK